VQDFADGDARVRPLLDTVRIIRPTADNAQRLWLDYQHSYRGDDDLLLRACSPEMGVDGLTENLTADDILASMQMPDTITLEAGSAEIADTGGFVIVRFATQEHGSRQGFRDYFLHKVFPEDALQFGTKEEQSEFFERMKEGLSLYFVEFVSRRGRAASAALVLAAYHEVCVKRQKGSSCTFVGKCLDSVRVGSCRNVNGNRPVKTLAESLGLRKVAVCDQLRTLHVPANACSHAREKANVSGDTVDAVLTFALYLGETRLAFERIRRQLDAL
jgi:hypothetical protein